MVLPSWCLLQGHRPPLRTTESQVHRQLSSALSAPVGFKNGTTGCINIAINAIISSKHPHSFLSITQQGVICIVNSKGNKDTCLILRGGTKTNYQKEYVKNVQKQLKESNIKGNRIIIDCSHGNSKKNYKNQPKVCKNICHQIAQGNKSIIGLMIESNLNEGNQKLIFGKKDELKYGVSITDSCINFETTEKLIYMIFNAVMERKKINSI